MSRMNCKFALYGTHPIRVTLHREKYGFPE